MINSSPQTTPQVDNECYGTLLLSSCIYAGTYNWMVDTTIRVRMLMSGNGPSATHYGD